MVGEPRHRALMLLYSGDPRAAAYQYVAWKPFRTVRREHVQWHQPIAERNDSA